MLHGLAAMIAALVVGCGGNAVLSDESQGGGGNGGSSGGGTGGTAGGGGGAGCAVPSGGEADGSFFLVLSLKLDEANPLLFDVTLSTAGQPSANELSWSVVALDAANRQDTVGTPSQWGPFAIGLGGWFEANMPGLTVPGAGNPFSGNEIVLTPSLVGALCRPVDFVCGDVTGSLTAPITYGIEGSTFTLTRIDALESYPEPPVINCDGETARAL